MLARTTPGPASPWPGGSKQAAACSPTTNTARRAALLSPRSRLGAGNTPTPSSWASCWAPSWGGRSSPRPPVRCAAGPRLKPGRPREHRRPRGRRPPQSAPPTPPAAGADGAGTVMPGVQPADKGIKLPQLLDKHLAQGPKPDILIIMGGINDLGAGNQTAAVVFGNLKAMYERAAGSAAYAVVAIAPWANRFVPRGSDNEAQRVKLAALLQGYAASQRAAGPPVMLLDTAEAGLFRFWDMPPVRRRRGSGALARSPALVPQRDTTLARARSARHAWPRPARLPRPQAQVDALQDDKLHLTAAGYDALGGHVLHTLRDAGVLAAIKCGCAAAARATAARRRAGWAGGGGGVQDAACSLAAYRAAAAPLAPVTCLNRCRQHVIPPPPCSGCRASLRRPAPSQRPSRRWRPLDRSSWSRRPRRHQPAQRRRGRGAAQARPARSQRRWRRRRWRRPCCRPPRHRR